MVLPLALLSPLLPSPSTANWSTLPARSPLPNFPSISSDVNLDALTCSQLPLPDSWSYQFSLKHLGSHTHLLPWRSLSWLTPSPWFALHFCPSENSPLGLKTTSSESMPRLTPCIADSFAYSSLFLLKHFCISNLNYSCACLSTSTETVFSS